MASIQPAFQFQNAASQACRHKPHLFGVHHTERRIKKACSMQNPQASSGKKNEDLSSGPLSVLIQYPLWIGGAGFVGVLANRIFSQVAPVVDANSAQSRADVICVVCSAALVLTGLNWLQLAPQSPPEVELDGEYSEEWAQGLPEIVVTELQWAWQAISSSTRCQSVVVFYQDSPVFQGGLRRKGSKLSSLSMGKICSKVVQSSQATYLAKLQLFPDSIEFLSYFPPNSQGVVVVPVSDSGVLVAGTNVQRGVGNLDQAWLASIGEKIGATLETEIPDSP